MNIDVNLQCEGVKWIRCISPENSKVFTSCSCHHFDSYWLVHVSGFDNIPEAVSLLVFKWFSSERDGGGADTHVGHLHCHQQRAASSLRGCCWCRVAGCSCICKHCLLLPLWHSSRSDFGLQAWYGCYCELSSSPSFHYLLLLFILLVGLMDVFYDGWFQGIWSGMLSGTILQTSVLFFMVYRTDWNKEVIDFFSMCMCL